MAVLLHPLEQEIIEADANQRGGDGGAEQRQPVGAAGAGDGIGQIGRDHVDRAMGEVQIIHHPEHDRQANGQQEQQHRELQGVQDLFNEEYRV